MTSESSHRQQIDRLRDSVFRRWWLITGGLWLTVGLLSLWGLRHEIRLIQEYFTWAAVRYALAHNRLSALGMGLCMGLSVALLLAESRHILWGLTPKEQERLEKKLFQIRRQGHSHPLWKQIVESETAEKDKN